MTTRELGAPARRGRVCSFCHLCRRSRIATVLLALTVSSVGAHGASATIAADLDGDGIEEVLSCEQARGVVSIRDARGRVVRRGIDAVPGATRMEAADVNGDGRPDLVVMAPVEDALAVLIARGDGSFAAPHAIPVGYEPHDVAAGDLNGDGHVDLVVLDSMPGGILVLLGDGRGGFVAHDRLGFDEVTGAVELADLDGDGHLDAAVTLFGEHAVLIAHGAGDGTLRRGAAIPVPHQPRCLALRDLDDDGTVDLLVSAVGTAHGITQFPGRGDGTFDEAAAHFHATRAIFDLTVGDVTGDGIDDLVGAGGCNGNYVGIVPGRGAGAFGPVEYVGVADAVRSFALVRSGSGGAERVVVPRRPAGITDEVAHHRP